MAYTYTWQKLVDMGLSLTKNIPLPTPFGPMQADFISSEIAAVFPWKPQITTFGDSLLPVKNGVQDYDPPINIWRLNEIWMRRTDQTPNETINLDVRDSLPIDLTPRSIYGIRACSLEAGAGQLRLECAPSLTDPSITWFLEGSYQLNPTKVSDLSQPLWIDDRYAWVAMRGVLYYMYMLADDTRMDDAYLKYQQGIERMKQAEDIGGDDQMFPSDPLGVQRASGFPNIFGI